MDMHIKLLGYRFERIHPRWEHRAGVYLIVDQTHASCRLLYVGEADSIARRFANHERLKDAIKAGANAVFLVECDSYQLRLALECLVRHFHTPSLNREPRPSIVDTLQAARSLNRVDIITFLARQAARIAIQKAGLPPRQNALAAR
jgi:hypothetical protein